MHLSDFALQQLDKAKLSELTDSQKEPLLEKALADLKEARERLNANSHTSSRPPSSDAPWSGVSAEAEMEDEPQSGEEPKTEASDAEGREAAEPGRRPEEKKVKSSSKAGRRPGSPGHSRSQRLAVSETIAHRPERCALCGEAL